MREKDRETEKSDRNHRNKAQHHLDNHRHSHPKHSAHFEHQQLKAKQNLLRAEPKLHSRERERDCAPILTAVAVAYEGRNTIATAHFLEREWGT